MTTPLTDNLDDLLDNPVLQPQEPTNIDHINGNHRPPPPPPPPPPPKTSTALHPPPPQQQPPSRTSLVRTLSKSLMKRSASVHKFVIFPTFPVSVIPAWLDGPYGCGITRLRHMLFLTLTETDSKIGVVWAGIMIATIVLSIISFCIASMPEYRIRAARHIHGNPEDVFDIIETVCITIFTFEYLGRLVCITAVPNKDEQERISKYGFRRPSPPVTLAIDTNTNDDTSSFSSSSSLTRGGNNSHHHHHRHPNSKHQHRGPLGYPRNLHHFYKWVRVNTHKYLAFILAPLNIIDVIAIAPYYVDVFDTSTDSNGNSSLTILRVLRLARVLRLFKVSKRMQGWQLMAKTITKVTDALGFLVFFIVLAMVLFGSIIFFCEGGEWDEATETFLRPNIFGNKQEATPFQSIPHSFWWTMVTMVTLGYGDFVPTTDWGRLFGAILMLLSILVLAMPITVIGNSFSAEYNIAKRQKAMTHAAALAVSMKFNENLTPHKSFQIPQPSIPSSSVGLAASASSVKNNHGSKMNTASVQYPPNNHSIPNHGSSDVLGSSTFPLPLKESSSTVNNGKEEVTIVNSSRRELFHPPEPSASYDEKNNYYAPDRERKGLYELGIAGTAAEVSFMAENALEHRRNLALEEEYDKYNFTTSNGSNSSRNNHETYGNGFVSPSPPATPASDYTSTNGDEEDNEEDNEEDYEYNQFTNLASAADMAIIRSELLQLRSDMAWVKGALDQILRNQQRLFFANPSTSSSANARPPLNGNSSNQTKKTTPNSGSSSNGFTTPTLTSTVAFNNTVTTPTMNANMNAKGSGSSTSTTTSTNIPTSGSNGSTQTNTHNDGSNGGSFIFSLAASSSSSSSSTGIPTPVITIDTSPTGTTGTSNNTYSPPPHPQPSVDTGSTNPKSSKDNSGNHLYRHQQPNSSIVSTVHSTQPSDTHPFPSPSSLISSSAASSSSSTTTTTASLTAIVSPDSTAHSPRVSSSSTTDTGTPTSTSTNLPGTVET